MSRKPNQSTLDAVALIGQPRDSDNKPHTAYSAAEAVGANANCVYKYWRKLQSIKSNEAKA
jgi:hypothetical protein